jgi:ubiquinone biosynthesis UbiH/UbiF/VisC/COQ6 family hydroxylase
MACELWESVKRQSNLTLFCPASPGAIEISKDAALLSLSDGKTLSAKLLIGADGRDSWVRQTVGLPAINTPYDEMGLVANFDCTLPHRGIARQWFRDDGVLAWLPLPGNRISIVWSTPDDHAKELLALSADELCTRVSAAGGHELGKLKLISPAAAFPLRLMRVPRTIAPRLALIGDAAHGIHPLSGHGINLGYQDAKALADLLAATSEWQDIGDERLLRRYQRARREETLLMQTTTHTLRRLFRENLPGLKPLRNIGMNLTNALPVLKNQLVRYALGAF